MQRVRPITRSGLGGTRNHRYPRMNDPTLRNHGTAGQTARLSPVATRNRRADRKGGERPGHLVCLPGGAGNIGQCGTLRQLSAGWNEWAAAGACDAIALYVLPTTPAAEGGTRGGNLAIGSIAGYRECAGGRAAA